MVDLNEIINTETRQRFDNEINPVTLNDTSAITHVNPSIGRIGQMYFDEINDRIKFFSTDIHTNTNNISEHITCALEEMSRYNTSRFVGRFFVNRNIELDNIEARIPLSGIYKDLDLIYISINLPNRVDSTDVRLQEDNLINNVLLNNIHLRNHISSSYFVEKLAINNLTDIDVFDMVKLYRQAFTTYTAELNNQTVRTMVEHSDVYAVRNIASNNEIVSTVVAEKSDILTNRGIFSLCELSEMATLREHRGQGLVTFATEQLLENLTHLNLNPPNLIYAEARACHRAINQSFHNLGFKYAGRLEKQCLLSGDSEIAEHGPYENLNVWYI